MTIQPIGAQSVALYLTPADLEAHGLTPEGITHDLALDLTRAAFLQAGMPSQGPMEIEAYPDPCGVLVFARLRDSQPVWFAFDSLENLLAAAHALSGPMPDAALALYEGKYWLSLPDGEGIAACRLTEFGTQAPQSPFMDARLREHGLALLPGQTLQILLKYFPDF